MTGPGDERPPDERSRPNPAVPSPPGQSPPSQPPPGQSAPGRAAQGQHLPHGQQPSAVPPPGPAQYGQQHAQPYGQAPYPVPPGSPPTEPPYVYNPYGDFTYPASYPSPAGLGPDAELPPKRPGPMHLALLFVVVSALPYLLVGLVAVLGAGQAATALPPDDLAQLQQLGVDIEQVVRATGAVILAIALGYVLLGVLAWTGRRWARGLLAATTAGFVLMVAASVLAAGSQGLALDGGSVLILAVPLILAVAGVGLMFGGAARDWFARRR